MGRMVVFVEDHCRAEFHHTSHWSHASYSSHSLLRGRCRRNALDGPCLSLSRSRVKASWAGGSGASGCTLAASVQEKCLGVAIMKSMESVSRHLTRFIMKAIVADQVDRSLVDVRSLPRNFYNC